MALTNEHIRHGDKPLRIRGRSVIVGAPAPDARLVELGPSGFIETSIGDLRGKVVLLSVVPSVDTSTCHAQTKHLAAALGEFGPAVTACTISLDLPFAQKRWLDHEACVTMRMLSDHKYRAFGEAFGTYIEGLGLLTRAVFVLDRTGVTRYADYVENLSAEPEYTPLISALRATLG